MRTYKHIAHLKQVYIHACTYMDINTYIKNACIYIKRNIHTYMHTYIYSHKYIQTFIHTYKYAYIYTHTFIIQKHT